MLTLFGATWLFSTIFYAIKQTLSAGGEAFSFQAEKARDEALALSRAFSKGVSPPMARGGRIEGHSAMNSMLPTSMKVPGRVS